MFELLPFKDRTNILLANNKTKQDKIMSEYYQVKEIEGKGTGCVALKEIKPGIMILQEKPQLKLKCGNWSFRDLAIAFKQMVKFTPSKLTK